MACHGGPNTLRKQCVVHQKEEQQHFLSLGIKVDPSPAAKARERTPGDAARSEPAPCPVCLEDAPDAALDKCGHKFHAHCLGMVARHLGRGTTRLTATVRCPLCRVRSRAPTTTLE